MHIRVSVSSTILALLILAVLTVGACSGTSTPAGPSNTAGGSSSGASSSGAGASSSSAGASANGGGTGTLTVRLTDSPFSDATAVLVTFSDVSVHLADPGDWKPLSASSTPTSPASTFPRTCDLKQLSGGVTDLLGVGSLDSGKYTQIRLTVTEAKIYFDAKVNAGPCLSSISAFNPVPLPPAVAYQAYDVTIPSGEIKLVHEFSVPPNTSSTITLDFDGDQSIHQTGSGNGSGNGRGNGQAQSGKYIMNPVVRVLAQ